MSPRSWRLSCLLVSCAALVVAPAAAAHQRAALTIEAPAEGATLEVPRAEVVIRASGAGLAEVEFAVHLDGEPVAVDGQVGSGSVFTTFALRAGESSRLVLDVDPGLHELRVDYTGDPDDDRPALRRTFAVDLPGDDQGARVVTGSGRVAPWPVVAAGVLVVGAGAAVVVRRRRRA